MKPAPYQRPRLAQGVRLQMDILTENPVLLYQETVILMNQTGYEVLRRCDGTQTLSEIISSLAREYQMAESTLFQDVSQYVGVMNQKGLVEWL